MSEPRILVAGIGNVFLGDDGFGVEVVGRLSRRALPACVRVVDFGIRGIDLAFAMERCDAAILVDATARGGAPGTLYVIEPEVGATPEPLLSPHALTPDRVLAMIPREARPHTVRVVGCEPQSFGDEDDPVGLSAPVSAAVDEAANMVEALVRDILASASASAGAADA